MADIAVNITRTLLENIVHKVQNDVNLIQEFEHDIKKLEKNLMDLQGLLNDAKKFPMGNQTVMVRDWMRELQDEALNAEDVFEICANHVPCWPGCLEMITNFFSEIGFRLEMGKEIRGVNAKLLQLLDRAEKLQARKMAISVPTEANAQFSSDVANSNRMGPLICRECVGLGPDSYQMKRFLKEFSNHKDIAVVGLGGIGKTTLLQHVYYLKMKEGHFNLVIWLSVSPNYHIKQLQKDVLQQLDIPYQGQSSPMLQQTIHVELNKRGSCLAILDDVWEVPESERIRMRCHSVRDSLDRIGLPSSCKLLISTRSRNVAKQMDAYQYELPPMTLKDARLLFQHEVGSSVTDLDVSAEAELSRYHGLPLAVKAISAVVRNEPPNCRAAALRAIHTLSAENANVVFHVLRLSFDALEQQYKPCFAFLGILGDEEDRIEADQLMGMWVAERLVATHLDAERALKQLHCALLVNKCAVSRPYTTEIDFHLVVVKKFVHDLAVSLYRECGGIRFPDSCNNANSGASGSTRSSGADPPLVTSSEDTVSAGPDIMEVVHYPKRSLRMNIRAQSPWYKFPKTVRTLRLSVGKRTADLSFLQQGRGLRVLSVTLKEEDPVPSLISSLELVVGKLPLLRYLHLEYPNMKRLPVCIQHLPLLEYLILCNCEISEVPSWLGKLHRLRFLSFSMPERQTTERQKRAIWCKLAERSSQKALKDLEVVKGITIELDSQDTGDKADVPWTWKLLGEHEHNLRHVNLRFKQFPESMNCPFTAALLNLDMEMTLNAGEASLRQGQPQEEEERRTFPNEWLESLRLNYLALKNITLPMEVNTQGLFLLKKLKLAGARGRYPVPLKNLPLLKTFHILDDDECEELPADYFAEGSFRYLKKLSLKRLLNLSKLPALHEKAMSRLRKVRITECSRLWNYCNKLEEMPGCLHKRFAINPEDMTLYKRTKSL